MTKPKPGDFGRWIKARRRELGLGRYRCAGRASIGGEALRLIECGRTCPLSLQGGDSLRPGQSLGA